jgi:hypothetical protein
LREKEKIVNKNLEFATSFIDFIAGFWDNEINQNNRLFQVG